MLLSFSEINKKYNLNINGIIHIGAHYGEEIYEYIENDVDNIVFFEPVSQNYDTLTKKIENIRDKKCIIKSHKLALGNHNKVVTMNLSSNENQSSSVLVPKKHLINHPNVLFNGTEEVKMVKLDSFGYKKYNFINIDVQGYELEVFKGAKNTLHNVDYVYCEVNRDEVYEDNAYVEEIDEFLKQYNFQRVETNWAGGIWGDAFYIKREIA
jgi:FkbM family methyltransferase